MNVVAEVCRVNTDWTKILNCKQNKEEVPVDYLYIFKDVFERYLGIACLTEMAQEAVGAVFVQGLLLSVKSQLTTISIGWQTKKLAELVTLHLPLHGLTEEKERKCKIKIDVFDTAKYAQGN